MAVHLEGADSMRSEEYKLSWVTLDPSYFLTAMNSRVVRV